MEEILKPTQHSVHVDRFSYAYEWYPVNGRVGVFITFIRETENRSEDKVFDRPDKVAYRRNGKQIDVSTAVIYKQTRSSKGGNQDSRKIETIDLDGYHSRIIHNRLTTLLAISPPMANEAVAAGLGAFNTCNALGRSTRSKS